MKHIRLKDDRKRKTNIFVFSTVFLSVPLQTWNWEGCHWSCHYDRVCLNVLIWSSPDHQNAILSILVRSMNAVLHKHLQQKLLLVQHSNSVLQSFALASNYVIYKHSLTHMHTLTNIIWSIMPKVLTEFQLCTVSCMP